MSQTFTLFVSIGEAAKPTAAVDLLGTLALKSDEFL